MEFTREIYWNVGQGAAVLLPMYALALVAVAVMLWGFWRRVRVYRQGRRPLHRTDALEERLLEMVKGVMLQGKVMRVPGAGTAHGLFFWGFFLLFIGTCLILLQADVTDPLFDVRFLQGDFYKAFSLVLDVAGLVALLMLGGLFVRRYLRRPAGLETGPDDAIMHGLLFTILISGFLIEGARMAVTELGTPVATWSPVGHGVALALAGLSEETLRGLHIVLWWGHLLLAVLFIALIPFTKFRHIFTTSANYLLADRGPRGKMVTLDLEDEQAESFGVARVPDLSWKDVLDADACTLCKRCQDRCPAFATDKPLSPMKIVNQIGQTAFESPESNLIETVSTDALWACTTARDSRRVCCWISIVARPSAASSTR